MPSILNLSAHIHTFTLLTITSETGITGRNRSCPKTPGDPDRLPASLPSGRPELRRPGHPVRRPRLSLNTRSVPAEPPRSGTQRARSPLPALGGLKLPTFRSVATAHTAGLTVYADQSLRLGVSTRVRHRPLERAVRSVGRSRHPYSSSSFHGRC